MTGRLTRGWVAGFIAVLAVFGVGQLEAWPFTSWYMFSHVEAPVARVAGAVAVSSSGDERALGSDTLPAGLLSHRLLQRLERASAAERADLCATLLAAARRTGSAETVRVEERSWRVLDRSGDRPADVRTRTVHTCS